MQTIKFVYTTPMIGTFENEGPDMTQAEIVEAIARDYPEAQDIEIVDMETEV